MPESKTRDPESADVWGGPLRQVVYIFDREGDRGGAYWLLVLACGHFVARKCPAITLHSMFEPIERKLAPRRAKCHCCGAGHAEQDPWILIKALGGPA